MRRKADVARHNGWQLSGTHELAPNDRNGVKPAEQQCAACWTLSERRPDLKSESSAPFTLGFFKAEGLKVEITTIDNAPALTAAIATNYLDVAAHTPLHMLRIAQ